MAKKKVIRKSASKSDIEDSNLRAFITTFFSIIGFIVAIILWKDDKYTMYYAKQSLVIFIGLAIAGVLGFIPIIGVILLLAMIILWAMSWIYALSGNKRDVWVVGMLAEKINL